MVKFSVNNRGLYIDKKYEDEFNKYVMTTSEIVDKLVVSMQSPIESDRKNTKGIQNMLISYFNDPNRCAIRINLKDFVELNVGYGIVDGKLASIIMWFDDNHLLNFAVFNPYDDSYSHRKYDNDNRDLTFSMFNSFDGSCKRIGKYNSNSVNQDGYIVRIYPTDGDVFIKNFDDAVKYRDELNKEKDEKFKKESSLDMRINMQKELINDIKKELSDIRAAFKGLRIKHSELSKRAIALKKEEHVANTELKKLIKQLKNLNN